MDNGFSLGNIWGDIVGLGKTYLESQGETRQATPDPRNVTPPQTTAVDESGRSMTAQSNTMPQMGGLPVWAWAVMGAFLLLVIILLIKG